MDPVINYFTNLSFQKRVGLVALLIIVLSIPLTVFILQKQQQYRQQAAAPEILPTTHKIKIDQKSLEKEYKRSVDRTPLQQSDNAVRVRLVNDLRKASSNPSEFEGVIYENANIRIEYVSAPDDFEAEILTQDINLAKSQAEEWFSSQGLSKEGICSLPLNYSLLPDVVNALPDGTTFDPNPLVCQ